MAVVVDEVHVVSQWGSSFRKTYGTLGILRALLPRGTPFVGMSATLGLRVRLDVLKKLQFDMKNYVNINLGNDRPNVSIVVRAMQNSMNTYSDLAFLIPVDARETHQVKHTMIYADSVAVATGMSDYLYGLGPESFRTSGIIRPYSAAYSSEYRAITMDLFKAGVIRILVCTDAAGMVRFEPCALNIYH